MFVRKKKNRSGTISVVVVSKAQGKFREIRNFGTARSDAEAEILCNEARHWLSTYGGQQIFDFEDRKGRELEETVRFLEKIDNVIIKKLFKNYSRILLWGLSGSCFLTFFTQIILLSLLKSQEEHPRKHFITFILTKI